MTARDIGNKAIELQIKKRRIRFLDHKEYAAQIVALSTLLSSFGIMTPLKEEHTILRGVFSGYHGQETLAVRVNTWDTSVYLATPGIPGRDDDFIASFFDTALIKASSSGVRIAANNVKLDVLKENIALENLIPEDNLIYLHTLENESNAGKLGTYSMIELAIDKLQDYVLGRYNIETFLYGNTPKGPIEKRVSDFYNICMNSPAAMAGTALELGELCPYQLFKLRLDFLLHKTQIRIEENPYNLPFSRSSKRYDAVFKPN